MGRAFSKDIIFADVTGQIDKSCNLGNHHGATMWSPSLQPGASGFPPVKTIF